MQLRAGASVASLRAKATGPPRTVASLPPSRSCCCSSPLGAPSRPPPSTSTTPTAKRSSFACSSASGKPSGSVIDAPQSTTSPSLEKGTHGSTKRPPIYKLMLHNDNYNRREYVVKVLVRVVDNLTKDDAINVMIEAHETGVAMVLACPQDEAEQYCESLRINGLSSSIEPGC